MTALDPINKIMSKWVFRMLQKHDDHEKISFSSVQTDFANGVNLLYLLEVLSGEKINNGYWDKKPKFDAQINNNLKMASDFISKLNRSYKDLKEEINTNIMCAETELFERRPK